MPENKLLSFLDNYFKATETLGQWWESSLASGATEESLRDYVLHTYLGQLYPSSPEMVVEIYSKWEEFNKPIEVAPESEVPVAQEPDLNIYKLEFNPIELTEQDYANTDLSSFIINYFGSDATGIQLRDWVVSQQHTGGAKASMDYIFDNYLMAAGWKDEQIIPLKTALINLIQETKNALQPKAEEPQIISIPEPIQEEVQTIMVDGPLNEVVTQTENVEAPVEYQGDAIDNLKNIRSLEEEIATKLNQVMLLKEPYLVDGNYVNNSYNFCPSFKNLIEPIQMAIIKKREAKAKEKWFEKYRPELVEEILFPNTTIKETITEYVMKGRIAGNCMFYGEGGVGKTTTNQVLMNAVLKNAADRFFLDRKIESVDNLKGWLNKKPLGEQKIVIAEEFDRLSDAAMTELKNGLMEKYEYVVFLASTNKIHKIDEALLTRFTLISKFDTAQVQDLLDKCRYVLTNERIQFTEEDLAYFIEANKLKGIRTILNNLQLSCYMGVFEPKRTAFFVGDSGTEYDMVNWIKWYIQYLIQCPKELLYALSYNIESDPNIAHARKTMLEILVSNYSLNYDYIFGELLKDNIFLPIKNCMNTYYQDIDVKRIKSMHFEAMLNDFVTILFTTKDVYK